MGVFSKDKKKKKKVKHGKVSKHDPKKHHKKGKKSKSKTKTKGGKGKHHASKDKKGRKPALEENLSGVVLVKDAKKKSAEGSGAKPPKRVPNPVQPSRENLSQEKAHRSMEPVASKEALARPAPLPAVAAPRKKRVSAASGSKETKSDEVNVVVPPSSSPVQPPPPPPPKQHTLAAGDCNTKYPSKEAVPVTPVQRPPTASTPPQEYAPRSSESIDDFTKKEERSDEKRGSSSFLDMRKKWKLCIEKLLNGGDQAIKNEYRSIRGYMPSGATRTDFDANPTRNRFEDIVCMDHTRVRLLDETYINASWVNIAPERKAILTQLPLPSTSSDFWKMVLEHNVQAILLILTPFEYHTFNAEATFPKLQDFLHFDDRHIRVGEFKQVKLGKHWAMHVYTLTDGEHHRYIHLHHYYGWTHGEGPTSIMDLWQIQSVFRKYSRPPVYMSLSGCGRAGTYAVFETAHDRLHSEHCSHVDVAHCVTRIRNGRLHSLQKISQLKAVHLALTEHVINNGFQSEMSEAQLEKWRELRPKQ